MLFTLSGQVFFVGRLPTTFVLMARSLISWWREDLARNTYIYTNFLIGIPFYLFGTYSVYQIQVTGFMIGTDGQGGPCLEYCIVPFGTGQIDLNSVLLYMNAMTFGIGGFVVIFIVAYADYWSRSLRSSKT